METRRYCSKGWDARCPKAMGSVCECDCDGYNHGNKMARPHPVLPLPEFGNGNMTALNVQRPRKKRGQVRAAHDEFKVAQQIKGLFQAVEEGMWKAAEILHGVLERKGYKALGYEDFDTYCESEIGKSSKMVRQLIHAYEIGILKLGMAASEMPDHTKMYIVSDLVEADPENAQEWVEKAKTLSADDLRKEKKNFKSGGKVDRCKHEELGSIIVLRTCKGCGEKVRCYDLETKLKALIKKDS